MKSNSSPPTILIADDNKELLEAITFQLSADFEIKVASSVQNAKAILRNNVVDVVVSDLCFEGQDEDGLDLIDFVKSSWPGLPVVLISGASFSRRFAEAMRRPLVDSIPKEANYGVTLRSAIEKGLLQKRMLGKPNSAGTFLSDSPLVKNLLLKVERIVASPSDFPILIIGETGVGKEVLAQHISKQLSKRVIAVNMAGVPRETAESELFGHVRGAFTGAVSNKVGLIEQAHGGIFFLDELGECSLALQAKMLRVLQEREIQPVGANNVKKVNVRFLAATNQNLLEMINKGLFRMDLYQRLNTIVLEIPPLRSRPEDIVLFSHQFMKNLFKDERTHLTAEAINELVRYSWPGNVRELKNVIERMVVLSEKDLFSDRDVIEAISQGRSAYLNPQSVGVATVNCRTGLGTAKQDHLRRTVLEALDATGGNRTKAAHLLGVNPATIHRHLKRLGIAGAIPRISDSRLSEAHP